MGDELLLGRPPESAGTADARGGNDPPRREAVLVGAGEVDPEELGRALRCAPLVIAADGGGALLERLGVTPDWLVGDFDSLDRAALARLTAGGVRVHRYPREKDWTDMEIALELAAELGAESATLFGATGDRLDHTLTNLSLLWRGRELGLRAVVRAPRQWIHLLLPGRTILAGAPGQAVSLVPLTTEAAGITTENLRYPLVGETLYLGRSRGVHNEFLAGEAAVHLAAGALLAFVFDPCLPDGRG